MNKPGWRTTEWWGKNISQAAAIWGMVGGFVPPHVAVPVTAALEVAYIVARTWLKKDLPTKPEVTAAVRG